MKSCVHNVFISSHSRRYDKKHEQLTGLTTRYKEKRARGIYPEGTEPSGVCVKSLKLRGAAAVLRRFASGSLLLSSSFRMKAAARLFKTSTPAGDK